MLYCIAATVYVFSGKKSFCVLCTLKNNNDNLIKHKFKLDKIFNSTILLCSIWFIVEKLIK